MSIVGICKIHNTPNVTQEVERGKWVPICPKCEQRRKAALAEAFWSVGVSDASTDPFNPRSLPTSVMSAIVSAYRCPNCLGDLDAGMECKSCEYWAQPWIDRERAKNDRIRDNREG